MPVNSILFRARVGLFYDRAIAKLMIDTQIIILKLYVASFGEFGLLAFMFNFFVYKHIFLVIENDTYSGIFLPNSQFHPVVCIVSEFQ